MSCAQRLHVSTVGLSRDGFTLKGGISSIRREWRNSFTHTQTFVLRENLDDALHHLLPWDIDLIIDDPVDEPEEEPEVQVCIIFPHTCFVF